MESLYERMQPLTVVARQHFVEWFSGDSLNTNIWTKLEATGGTVVMADSIDGGALCSCNTTAGGAAGLTFNVIEQFDHNGSQSIFVVKPNGTTNTRTFIGLSNGAQSSAVRMQHESGDSFYQLQTNNTTEVATTIPLDTGCHVHKVSTDGTRCDLSIDGSLEAITTSTVPASAMLPFIQIYNKYTTTNASMNIRYMEAYNT